MNIVNALCHQARGMSKDIQEHFQIPTPLILDIILTVFSTHSLWKSKTQRKQRTTQRTPRFLRGWLSKPQREQSKGHPTSWQVAPLCLTTTSCPLKCTVLGDQYVDCAFLTIISVHNNLPQSSALCLDWSGWSISTWSTLSMWLTLQIEKDCIPISPLLW